MAFKRDVGTLPVDAQGRSVQEFVDFTMFDDSGVVYSPIAAGTTEVAIPAPAQTSTAPGGWMLHVYAPDADVWLRGATSVDTSGLFPILQATVFKIPTYPGCTRYIKRVGSTAVYFMFLKLGPGGV